VVEPHHVHQGVHHAGLVVHHDHPCGAEHRSRRGEALDVHGDIALIRVKHVGGGPAGDHRLELPPLPDPAAGVVDQGEEVDPHRELVGAGALDVTAHAEQLGTRAPLRTDLLVGLRADLEDVGEVGEGLDVVHHGRAAEQALDRGEGRLELRLPALSLEGGEHAGLLAADVGPGAAVDRHVQLEVGPEHLVAEVPLGVGLLDRLHEATVGEDVLPADVDVGGVDPHRPAGDDDPLQELVGVLLHDHPVLEGPGLRLIGVHREVLRLVGLLRNEAPLHPGREARAAAPPEVRRLDLLDQVVRRPVPDRLAGGLVATLALVEGEGVGGGVIGPAREDLLEAHRAPPRAASWRHSSMIPSTS